MKKVDNIAWAVPADARAILAAWLAKTLKTPSGDVQSFRTPKDNGKSSSTYLLDIEWGSGSDRRRDALVVRQEPPDNGVFYEADIAKWARAQKILGDHAELRVPKVYFLEEDRALLGGRFFV